MEWSEFLAAELSRERIELATRAGAARSRLERASRAARPAAPAITLRPR